MEPRRCECKFVYPLWKTLRKIPQNFKTELLYNPGTPLLSIHLSEENKNTNSKDTCMYVHCIYLQHPR